MSKKLEKIFEIPFSGTIWKLHAVPQKPHVILELRDSEALEAHFSGLDLLDQSFFLDNQTFEDSWWMGVSAVTDQYIIFHRFEDSENPQDKSLIAFDFKNQGITQELKNHELLEVGKSHWVVRSQEEEPKVSWLSLKDGHAVASDEVTPFTNDAIFQYPHQYLEETEYFDTVARLVKTKLVVDPVQSIEYWQSDAHIVLSYHTREKQGISNEIVVLDVKGNVLLQETLDQNLKGMSKDTFFLSDNRLIFVQEKKKLLSYSLN